MINKQVFSKTDLADRIVKTPITHLENRKQFFFLGWGLFFAWLFSMALVYGYL